MTPTYDFENMSSGNHAIYNAWIVGGLVNPHDLDILEAYIVWQDEKTDGEYSRRVDAIQAHNHRQEKRHYEEIQRLKAKIPAFMIDDGCFGRFGE